MLETFMEAILWKPFQLFRCILNYSSGITKAPFLQCWFQSKQQAKNKWSPLSWGWSRVWHTVLCFKKILEQNRPVCWGMVARRNHMLVPHISGHLLLTASLRWRRMSMYISLSSSNSCKLLQQIPGTFWSHYLMDLHIL